MNDTERPFSPGLKGVLAGETALAMVDGENGRLLYRGYPIGELVERGTYAQVAELLWTGEWVADAQLACAPLPGADRGHPAPPAGIGERDGCPAHGRLGVGRAHRQRYGRRRSSRHGR